MGLAECGPKAFEGFVGARTPGQGLGLSAEQGGKQGCEQTETFDETAIEIGESKESLQFFNKLVSRPFRNSCYLPLVYLDTLLSDDVAEELHHGAVWDICRRYQSALLASNSGLTIPRSS